ncbi:hypothetical protein H2O64_17330 [Kordia sp. YSTF-M3]|uniref:Uncharacterized protein n=1 Tax=Kordia aestuariivivens TaxID=2759037 RepID=A0ABR7QD16_9FLAO|nr:hypothetical protein [Kordia aestuariivivens]MBC8756440.1 hypothetical protein [Kordia aestuariivivens]
MKKIITVIALCFATIGFAQDKKDTKDVVLTEMTQEVCECVSEKSSEGLTKEEVEIQLGLCMMKSYGKYKDRLDKYLVVSLDDANSLEVLGQEIGFKMLELCPDTFMVFAKDLIEDEIKEQSNAPSKGSNTAVLGNVVKLTNDQFNIVTFKGENKREYKLLWLEYFEGQELLSDVKNLKKSKMKVSYESKEMYDPKLKDYRTYKVLRKLEVLN